MNNNNHNNQFGQQNQQTNYTQHNHPNAQQGYGQYNQPNANAQQNYNQQGYNPQGQPKSNAFKDFIFNTPKAKDPISEQDINDNKMMCIFSYLGVLFFIPLLASRDSRYARFHSNQGLILFCTNIIISIVNVIITTVIRAVFLEGYYIKHTSQLGNALAGIVSLVFSLLSLSLIVLGIYNAVKGRANELPIIGKFRFIKTVPVNNYNANNFNGNMNNGFNNGYNSTNGFNPNTNGTAGYNNGANNFNSVNNSSESYNNNGFNGNNGNNVNDFNNTNSTTNNSVNLNKD